LAADVGKTLGVDIPLTEELAKLSIRLSGGKLSV
jgi:hypothetical protein